MAKTDKHFKNVFSGILGILIAIAIALFIFSRFTDDDITGARLVDDPLLQEKANERIRPFGRVAVAGQDNGALAIEEPPAVAPAASPAAEPAATVAAAVDGAGTYQSACAVCHTAGIAGAPRVGDKAGWAARIAQGPDTLNKHAIKGFQGVAGMMPAKGGRLDLSDAAVIAAVEHMVNQSR